jgi:spore coat protein U-like protein
MNLIKRSLLALGLVAAAGSASANDLEVGMEILPGCQINPIAPINLGSVEFIDNTLSGNTTVQVRCGNGTPYQLTFDNGTGDIFATTNGGNRFRLLLRETSPGVFDTTAFQGIAFSLRGGLMGGQTLLDRNEAAFVAANNAINATGSGAFQNHVITGRVTPADQTGFQAPGGVYKAIVNAVLTF